MSRFLCQQHILAVFSAWLGRAVSWALYHVKLPVGVGDNDQRASESMLHFGIVTLSGCGGLTWARHQVPTKPTPPLFHQQDREENTEGFMGPDKDKKITDQLPSWVKESWLAEISSGSVLELALSNTGAASCIFSQKLPLQFSKGYQNLAT